MLLVLGDFLLLRCRSSLCILEINPLSIYGLKVFLSFHRLLFILLAVPFAEQKFFSMMRSYLSISVFAAFAFDVNSHETIVKTNVMKLFPISF